MHQEMTDVQLKVLNEREECTRYKRSKIRRLSSQFGLDTANKQITSSRDINAEIGNCPLREAKTGKRLLRTSIHCGRASV